MTARRRLLAAASATFALTALTACEKPAPLVTVVSGGTSVYSQAAAYCFDEGQTLQDGDCATRATELRRLEVRQGERIGIDVDKELVERGWQLELVDPADPQSAQASSTITDHYFPFTAPGIAPGGKLVLTVRTVGEGDAPTGEWQFELVNRA
ncbi:MAG: hypothetical protein JWM62_159 [Frankiales bacterium]|jgi:hypothetical protein|nr:hypothetical protein [Frankiales bacterium]